MHTNLTELQHKFGACTTGAVDGGKHFIVQVGSTILIYQSLGMYITINLTAASTSMLCRGRSGPS